MSMLNHVLVVYTLAWIPMVFIAIANAIVREMLYGQSMSELSAHQVSTVTAVILFGIYIWILARVWKIQTASQALTIGLVWLALTAAFEFLFGHFVMAHSWSRLLEDYNIFNGRLWLLVLIWITVAPYLFFRLVSASRPHHPTNSHDTGARPT